jgi:hypothetical protein
LFSILFLPNHCSSHSFIIQGWGATSNGIGSGPVNLLQKVMFSTITNEVCVDAVVSVNRDGSLVDDQKFCTGPLTGGKSNLTASLSIETF